MAHITVVVKCVSEIVVHMTCAVKCLPEIVVYITAVVKCISEIVVHITGVVKCLRKRIGRWVVVVRSIRVRSSSNFAFPNLVFTFRSFTRTGATLKSTYRFNYFTILINKIMLI